MDLESLDLFKLLHLSHFNNDEKKAYLEKLSILVLNAVTNEVLPLYMTEEEIDQFNALTDKEETRDQAMAFIKAKIPEIEEILKTRMLELKKDLIKSNIEQRLDVNRVARENLRKVQDGEETAKKILDVEKEKTLLEKVLVAVEADDWGQVDQLLS